MKKSKRIISAILSLGMIFGCIGCGSKEEANEKSDYVNYVYSKDSSFGPIGEQTRVNWMTLAGDTLYYYENNLNQVYDKYMEVFNGDASSTDAKESLVVEGAFYKADKDGKKIEKLSDVNLDYSLDVNKSFVSPDGKLIYYILEKNNNGDYTYVIYKSEGGEFSEVKDITQIVSGDGYMMTEMFAQNDGSFIAVYGSGIKTFDENFNEISDVKSGDSLEASSYDKDNNIICKTTTYDAEGNGTTQGIVYNVAQKTFGQPFDLEVSTTIPVTLSRGSGEYDFYLCSVGNVYGCKYADKSRKKIMSFESSDIDRIDISNLEMVSPEEAYFIYSDDSNKPCPILRYKKVDPKDVEKRKVLTLASANCSNETKKAVKDFNDSQTDYKIVITDYGEESDPAAKLSADISAGKIPDMYDIYYHIGGMPIEQCEAKGLLEDLGPYIEKDEELSESDFIPSAYEALKVNGKVLFVSSEFQITTIIGKDKDLGGKEGWTAVEMKEYVDSKPEGAKVLGFSSKLSVLVNLLNGCGNDFIDWDKGECYYDSPDFKALLEMANRTKEEEVNYDEEPSEAQQIKNDQLLLQLRMPTMTEIPLYDKVYGGKFTYIGYPSKDKSGSRFIFNNCIGMSSKCSDKDGAWKFMRTFLTADYEKDRYFETYEPIREDMFAKKVEALKATKDFTDEYGNEITAVSGKDSMEEIEIDKKPVTDEDAARYRALIDNAKGLQYYNNAVDNIIEEEVAAYFSGDKSVDEVCKIIQDRVSTYVNENK